MQDLDSSEDVVTIIPQEEAIIIELNAYFSAVPSVKGEALKADKYRSSRLNILGVNNFLYLPFFHLILYIFSLRNLPMPLRASRTTAPSLYVYITSIFFFRFLKISQIFVEDSPPAVQVAGAPEYDDS